MPFSNLLCSLSSNCCYCLATRSHHSVCMLFHSSPFSFTHTPLLLQTSSTNLSIPFVLCNFLYHFVIPYTTPYQHTLQPILPHNFFPRRFLLSIPLTTQTKLYASNTYSVALFTPSSFLIYCRPFPLSKSFAILLILPTSPAQQNQPFIPTFIRPLLFAHIFLFSL